MKDVCNNLSYYEMISKADDDINWVKKIPLYSFLKVVFWLLKHS